MRPGGREDWAVKIIENFGKSLYRCIEKKPTHLTTKKCLPAQNKKKQQNKLLQEQHWTHITMQNMHQGGEKMVDMLVKQGKYAC